MPTRLGRTALAAALTLIALTTNAHAEPSPVKARAKLVKLNEKADQLVEQYNQATETYKKAKKKYDTVNAEYGSKGAQADALRRDLVTVAVNDYQFGSWMGWERFVAEGSPEQVLTGMVTVQQITRARAEKVRAFKAATKDLRDRREEAQKALAEAETARAKVGDDKAEVDKLVKEQLKLLRSLGAFKSGDPTSPGIRYTGPASGNARSALEFAFAQIGKPYRYGGTGPGSFDCSGLTQAAWRTAGVELPRTTYTQWAWGAGRRVSLDALQPGDLLFSKGLGHMGMYVGNGKMVHAPQTGDVIKVSDLDDYWRNRLLGAIRP
ncbi:C40 family peptidase [Nonomuraea sp. NPDC050383]|uniref:C40 family peptidase n=1 Tax=Nonomuraea sp. NPDC050383 TaxID=3364362 RepID=UPI0037ABD59F